MPLWPLNATIHKISAEEEEVRLWSIDLRGFAAGNNGTFELQKRVASANTLDSNWGPLYICRAKSSSGARRGEGEQEMRRGMDGGAKLISGCVDELDRQRDRSFLWLASRVRNFHHKFCEIYLRSQTHKPKLRNNWPKLSQLVMDLPEPTCDLVRAREIAKRNTQHKRASFGRVANWPCGEILVYHGNESEAVIHERIK